MITITERAVAALKDYLKQEDKEDHGFRVVAQQGCCSLQYGFFLAEQAGKDDTVLDHEGLKLYIDPQSGSLLEGAKIDYVDGEEGTGFYIDNPNEANLQGDSCSCEE